MEANYGMRSGIDDQVERGRRPHQRFLIESVWEVECVRAGKVIWTERNKNLCTDEGLNALLNIMFTYDVQLETWYIAIFNTYTTILETHTYAAPGYTESTDYDEATRPEFVPASATAKMLTNNASKASFTMNAETTIYGAALVSGVDSDASIKGNTTADGGVLYCASKFSNSREVEVSDILNVTVTLTAEDV